MNVGAATHTGLVRRENEDSYCTLSLAKDGDTEVQLAGVADGMGGGVLGGVASRLALGVAANSLLGVGKALAKATPKQCKSYLVNSVLEANASICRFAKDSLARNDMGTTLSLALIRWKVAQGKGDLFSAHVGDSRIYLVKTKESGARGESGDPPLIKQITLDHSVVGELVRSGEIDEEEAMRHPKRNLLTQAVGTMPDISVDLGRHSLSSGDAVVLCTDGLTSLVCGREISRIVVDAVDPGVAAAQLAELANARGGFDNVTVVVISL